VKIKVYGKVNLSLSILGLKGGMHLLDSLMINAPVYDTVSLSKRKDKEVFISYKGGEVFENDNALKAGKAVVAEYKTNGANIRIAKGIPIGAGLGGSSASTAGVVKAMEKAYGFKASKEFLLSLGSDTNYMYHGGAKRIKGIGEIIEDISLPKIYVAVAHDNRLKVSTKECYKLYDKVGGDNIGTEGFIKTLNNPKNALSRSAELLCPQIKDLTQMVESAGFRGALLSGSGSAVFGYSVSKNEFKDGLNKLKQITKNHKSIRIYW